MIIQKAYLRKPRLFGIRIFPPETIYHFLHRNVFYICRLKGNGWWISQSSKEQCYKSSKIIFEHLPANLQKSIIGFVRNLRQRLDEANRMGIE